MTAAMASHRHAARRDRLRRHWRKDGVAAMLVSHPVHVHYLTGFTGEATHLVMLPDRDLLISDFRFRQQLSQECPDLEVVIRPVESTLWESTGRWIARAHVSSVAFESAALRMAEWELLQSQAPKVQWVSTTGVVERLRQVKDKDEIQQIREAVHLAERVYQMARAGWRGDQSERDVAAEIEFRIRWLGGDGCSFPPIVAVGERSALPHAPPSTSRLDGAPMTLIDWGARARGYSSDLTRLWVCGKPGDRLRKVYRTVLAAQEAAILSIRPGVRCLEVDRAARGVIEDAGYGKHFGHAVGHGIGLEVHEAPRLGPGQQEELQAGMVVTVEPGIYLPGWGGVRIEDDVLVTREGCEVLSQVTRDLDASVL